VDGSTATALRSVADDVECPSLSPNGTRIANKAAVNGGPSRVGDRTIGYEVQRDDEVNDVRAVPDGSGTPTVLVPEAPAPIG
jgi:hypothetical protein